MDMKTVCDATVRSLSGQIIIYNNDRRTRFQCLAQGQQLARCAYVSSKQQHLDKRLRPFPPSTVSCGFIKQSLISVMLLSDSAHTVGSVMNLQFQSDLRHREKKNNNCSFQFHVFRVNAGFSFLTLERVKVILFCTVGPPSVF